MYERNEKQVVEAYNRLSKVNKSTSSNDLREICSILRDSESRIEKQLSEFNLKFTSLSELNTLGGPYAGMFWSEEGNFIVIACKGNKLEFS